jgi:prepilin-type processing-associated H-X9-DG protein
VAFIATSGGDALQGDFQKTALGRIWNDPNVRSFGQALKTQLLAKAGQQAKDQNVPQQVDMVLGYVRLILSRPLVAGVAQAQVKKGPPVCGFVLVDAGARKADLTAAVSKLEAMAGQDKIAEAEVGALKLRKLKDDSDLPLYWGWAGNYLVVAAGGAPEAVVKYVASPRAAASYLGKVPGSGDALAVYYDLQRLAGMAGALSGAGGDAKKADVVQSVFKGLGLAGGKAVVRVGFAGADLVLQSLLEVPMPATGLLAAYKPADPAWLGAVDMRAVKAGVINFDLASLYDTVMNVIKAVAPDDGYLKIRQGIVDFEAEAKLRIREGLLASLAGPALFYTLPAGPIAESPRGGLVVLAKLKDPALFEKTMAALGEFAGTQSKGALQITAQTRDGGRTVHVWTVAQLMMLGVTPAWSIANDHVVIGSSVELCDLAVKQLVSKGANGKSLLDAEGYKKVAANLPKDLVMLSYTDSGTQLAQTMMQLQQFWPILSMVAMQAGITLPPTLPALTKIARDLGPSVRYQYFSPEGLREYYRGPGIEPSQGAIIGGAVGAGVALPALARSREQARSAVAMSNLKQIGLAVILYAEEHQDKGPADLEQVKPYLGNSPGVLNNPRKPKDFAGPGYVYVASEAKIDARNILVYENPGFCTDRINVVFGDGHVEAMKPEAFREALKATCTRLGKEMPEVKFKGESAPKPRPVSPTQPGQK